MPPHLVTVNRWLFTVIVASGFEGSEPGRRSNTSKSKGWKNWPGDEDINSEPLSVAMGAIATGFSGLMQGLIRHVVNQV